MIDQRVAQILEKLRALREAKKLSQADIAARLGLSQNSYKEIEKGSTHLKVQTLFQLADILEADLPDLLGIMPPNKTDSQENEEILLALDARKIYEMLQEISNKQNDLMAK